MWNFLMLIVALVSVVIWADNFRTARMFGQSGLLQATMLAVSGVGAVVFAVISFG